MKDSVKKRPFSKNKNYARVFKDMIEIKGLAKSPRDEQKEVSPDISKFMKFSLRENATSGRTHELQSPALSTLRGKQPPATQNLNKRSRTKVTEPKNTVEPLESNYFFSVD